GIITVKEVGKLPTEITEYLAKTSCNCYLEINSEPIELVRKQFQNHENNTPDVKITGDDLAYISFTSGSTGEPKGILGIHKPLSHFIDWHTQTFDLKESDRFSMISGISHDPLLRDIFTPLSLGATLYIPEKEDIETPGKLAEWIVEKQITVSHLTPAMGQLLIINTTLVNNHQRYFFFGGDVLKTQDIDNMSDFAPHATCVNFYGSTETPQAMGYFITSQTGKNEICQTNIPVGTGIADVQLLILNQQKKLAGIGELGEIYVRTPYLTKGYIGSVEMTNDKYSINPFTQINEDRIYKTGDLGRYLPDGNIEFWGRSDNQVKIRGFRIEPGEISATINQNSLIKASVVIAREDEPGNKNLVAYVVPEKADVEISELRQFLKQRLPEYMIPLAFVTLEKLPVTANGKIDKRALPAPNLEQQLQKTFVAATNPIEQQLIDIWEEVLGVKPVGINDNFFELGGHSLIGVRLFAEIEKLFGKKLQLATLFQTQTIAELAELLTTEKNRLTETSSVLVKIQSGGAKPTLFCAHPIGGNVLEYYSIAKYLGEEQPVYGLQSIGLDGKQAPLTKLEDMAKEYIKEMKSVQPEGPYYLLGYSFGGMLAFEIAQQLYRQGDTIAALVLLDRRNSQFKALRPSFIKSLEIHIKNLSQLDWKGRYKYFLNRVKYKYVYQGDYSEFMMNQWGDSIDSEYENVFRANLQAMNNYQPQVYPGKLTLLRCRVQPLNQALSDDLGWSHLVDGDVEVYPIPGDHFGLLKEPYVQDVAQTLKLCLHNSST
ncbi:MAG: AMP-binding protein, partial [Sphaerospermopsis sp. SIO1G2]|nr:AMP-binding protein [Sphaerospermopsis sp. SIO1G2]